MWNAEEFSRTRRETGLRAKELWRRFKGEIDLFSIGGLKALRRYLAFKIGAALIGFPESERFRKRPSRELLQNRQVFR